MHGQSTHKFHTLNERMEKRIHSLVFSIILNATRRKLLFTSMDINYIHFKTTTFNMKGRHFHMRHVISFGSQITLDHNYNLKWCWNISQIHSVALLKESLNDSLRLPQSSQHSCCLTFPWLEHQCLLHDSVTAQQYPHGRNVLRYEEVWGHSLKERGNIELNVINKH